MYICSSEAKILFVVPLPAVYKQWDVIGFRLKQD